MKSVANYFHRVRIYLRSPLNEITSLHTNENFGLNPVFYEQHFYELLLYFRRNRQTGNVMHIQMNNVALINVKIGSFITAEGVRVGKRLDSMNRHLENEICWKLKEIVNNGETYNETIGVAVNLDNDLLSFNVR